MDLFENKVYKEYDAYSVMKGVVDDCLISVDLLKKLSKSLGFSYELYLGIASMDAGLADNMVSAMSKNSDIDKVILLLDTELSEVVGFSLDNDRLPILNSDFLNIAIRQLEASSEIEIAEKYYDKDDTMSSIIIKRKDPIIVEEKYENSPSISSEYSIGVLVSNDELGTTSTRLVVYIEGQPLYLPASYYNATTNRFKRSTKDNLEALEVLLLKIVEDLRDDLIQSKIEDFHYRYKVNKQVMLSYEEYNNVLKTMRKIPTIIEDSSLLDNLLLKYEDFERKYNHLEDQKSSYVWRCTALSDIPIRALISLTVSILSDLYAPSSEYYDIRDLLGYYVSTPRIAEEIAKESIL